MPIMKYAVSFRYTKRLRVVVKAEIWGDLSAEDPSPVPRIHIRHHITTYYSRSRGFTIFSWPLCAHAHVDINRHEDTHT